MTKEDRQRKFTRERAVSTQSAENVKRNEFNEFLYDKKT